MRQTCLPKEVTLEHIGNGDNFEKNSFVVISIILLMLIFSSGCSSFFNRIQQENDCQYIDSSNQSLNSVYDFDIYSNEENSDFNKSLVDFPIDKNYELEIVAATTTEEFSELQNKYINQWKEEINQDISVLKSLLSEEDIKRFNDSQDVWENSILKCSEFDYDVLQNEQYDTVIGSSFIWMRLSNVREEYRRRSYHIKYLIYLLKE